MLILRCAGAELPWEALCQVAEDARLVLPLREGLQYLADTLAAPVPPPVLERLAAAPVARLDRWTFAFCNRPKPPPWRRWERLGMLWYRHSCERDNESLGHRLAGFPGFLGRWYGLRHTWELPLLAARKAFYHARLTGRWWWDRHTGGRPAQRPRSSTSEP